MPFQCEPQHTFGYDFCITRCPSIATGVFEQIRVEREADRPAAEPRTLDVAVLDMNHGWPNIGHDAIVNAIQTIACDVRETLLAARLRVRAVSYDIRRGGVIPPRPNGASADAGGGIYVGTGGPGHLDPRENDGVSAGSQGIHENPAWEAPLFALFDAIHDDRRAALLGVCHTFGVMCRWLRVADPVLRGAEKGGKAAGILDNVLTPAAETHPWFRHLVEEARGDRISILDNRLYDLIPTGAWRDVAALSYEASGESLTMMEVDREADEPMPRILAVNHHPEVVNRARVLTLLWQKRARGEVSHAWYEERAAAMTQTLRDESSDRGLDLTSRYTFFEPLRFHIYKQLRARAAALGETIDLDEAAVLEWARIAR